MKEGNNLQKIITETTQLQQEENHSKKGIWIKFQY